MAFLAAQNLSTTYEDYPGYWLKFYLQGTVTPLSMSIDSSGGTLLAKAEISSGGTVPIGFLATVGDSIFQPYLDSPFDAWIFPTASEADVNDTTNAIKIADNVDLQSSEEALSAELAALSAQVIKVFDTVALMVASTTLTVGESAQTLGYISAGDGGDNTYEIVAAATGTDDGGSFIDLVTHQAQGIFPRDNVNVRQFGAVGDSFADDTSALSNAITFARLSIGDVFLPKGDYRVTNQIEITSAVRIYGTESHTGVNNFSGIVHRGTRIRIDFLVGVAPSFFFLTGNSVRIEGIQFYSDQPSGFPGWVPTQTPWAIYAFRAGFGNDGGDGAIIRNISLYGLSHGIKADGSWMDIKGVRACCFNTIIDLDGCFDVTRIDDFIANSSWFSTDSDIFDYINQNCVGLRIGRVDNPQFSNIFIFGCKIGVEMYRSTAVSPSGAISLGNFVNFGFDFVSDAGIKAISNDIVATFTNGYVQGDSSVASKGVHITSDPVSNVRMSFNGVRFSVCGAEAILCESIAANLHLDDCYINDWAITSTAADCFSVAAGSFLSFGNIDFVGGGTGRRFGGLGTYKSGNPTSDVGNAAALDTSGDSISISASANYPILLSSGMMILNSAISGEVGVFIFGATAVTLISQTGSLFETGNSPSPGKVSLGFNGTTYSIFVGSGANQTLHAALIRTRAAA